MVIIHVEDHAVKNVLLGYLRVLSVNYFFLRLYDTVEAVCNQILSSLEVDGLSKTEHMFPIWLERLNQIVPILDVDRCVVLLLLIMVHQRRQRCEVIRYLREENRRLPWEIINYWYPDLNCLLHLFFFETQAAWNCDKVCGHLDHGVELVCLIQVSLSLLVCCTVQLVPYHFLFEWVILSILVLLSH